MLQRSNFLICFRFYHIPTDHFLKMKSMYAWKYTSTFAFEIFLKHELWKKCIPNDYFIVQACDSLQRKAIFYMQRIR
jgi:hypothetical protein